MRALKIAGIVLAALAGVVVLAALAVALLVDPNDYRDDIARIAQEKTGRPLQIRGDLALSLFPWIALDIRDVALGNPPGYGEEPFLTVRQASIGVKLLPLLRRQVEVRRVSVDGLAVTLVSRGEERNNWRDLTGAGEEQPAAPAATSTRIAGLDVSNSTLIYRDEAKQSVTRLTSLEAHTGPMGGAGPLDAQLAFDYDDGGGKLVAHVETRARIVTSPDSSRLEVQNLEANGLWYGSPDEDASKPRGAGAGASGPGSATASVAGGPPVKPEGKAVEFSLSAPSLVLDTNAGTLAPSTLEAKAGALPVKLSVQGDKLLSDYVLSGEVEVPRSSPRESMKSFGIEPPQTSDPKALSSFAMKSAFRLTQTKLALSGLDVSLDETSVKGSAGVDDLDTMALRFDLAVNAIDVDRYLGPESETPQGAAGSAAVPAPEPTELPLDLLRSLDAKGRVRVGRATVTGLQLTDVSLPLAAKNGRMHLGPTQAKLFGGTYDGNLVLDAGPAVATLSMDERVRGVDIGALMKARFDTTHVVGRGNANARLTAAGNTDIALFRSLAGKIDFDIRDGAVTGLDLWYELRRATALFKRQALPQRPAGEPKTDFRALAGSAVIDDGVVRNDDLLVDMMYIRAKGKGTLALASQAIDYRLTTEIYRLPDEAAAEMADLKAAEIPVTITGTLADMQVRPDVRGYLESRIKKEVDRKVDEKKEELRRKLGDKLRSLLGD